MTLISACSLSTSSWRPAFSYCSIESRRCLTSERSSFCMSSSSSSEPFSIWRFIIAAFTMRNVDVRLASCAFIDAVRSVTICLLRDIFNPPSTDYTDCFYNLCNLWILRNKIGNLQIAEQVALGHQFEKLGGHQAVTDVVRMNQLAEEALVNTAGGFRQFENLEIWRLALPHRRLQRRAITCHQLRLGRVRRAVTIRRADHDHLSVTRASELHDLGEVVNVLTLGNARHRSRHSMRRHRFIARTQPARRVRKHLTVIDQPANRYRKPARVDRLSIRHVAHTRIVPTKTRDHHVRLEVVDIATQPRESLMRRVTRHGHWKHFDRPVRIRVAQFLLEQHRKRLPLRVVILRLFRPNRRDAITKSH